MLNKVFNYVKSYPLCTTNEIAKALGLNGLDVLAALNELQERKFVKMTILPLSVKNNDSARYSITKKEYNDDSKFCVCKKLRSVTTDTESSEFGYWDTCCLCGKHLEDGFHYYNHFDGEDHDDMDF